MSKANTHYPKPPHRVRELTPNTHTVQRSALAAARGQDDSGSTKNLRHFRGPTRILSRSGAPDRGNASALSNLPPPAIPLIGRDHELAELRALLTESEARLVTLTGAAGCGKSRLALEVAASVMSAYPDGVWWVDLAHTPDADEVVTRIRATLQMDEDADESPTAVLSHLESKRLLLLLDDCEPLTRATADVIHHILAAARAVTILATSREPLRLPDERTWHTQALAVPTAAEITTGVDAMPPDDQARYVESLAEYDAVRLFVARAQAARPGFALTPATVSLVGDICRQLEGRPRAILLAAERSRVLSVVQIASTLGDLIRPPRPRARQAASAEQSLRAGLEWSHARLSPPDQRVFRSLAVFEGSASLEAVEAVCAPAELSTLEVLDSLVELVDAYLLQVESQLGAARYRLPVLSRTYAAEKLTAAGEGDTVRAAHAAFFACLAEAALPHLDGPQQIQWMARLDLDRDNLHAALAWSLEVGDAQTALRLSASLWPYWQARGVSDETRQFLDAALALSGTNVAELHIRTLDGAATLAYLQGDGERAETLHTRSLALKRESGDEARQTPSLCALAALSIDRRDYERAETLCQEALSLSRERRDRRATAYALLHLGRLRHACCDYRAATALFDEAVAAYRVLGDARGLALALSAHAATASVQGRRDEARTLADEALGLRRELHDEMGIAASLADLGALARDSGHLDHAAELLHDSLTRYRHLRARGGVARVLADLALLAVYQDNPAHARMTCAESLTLYEELGASDGIATALSIQALVTLHDGDSPRALALAHRALEMRRSQRDQHGIAECLDIAAAIYATTGPLEHAPRLEGIAAALRETIGAPRPPAFDADLRCRLSPAVCGLGAEPYEALRHQAHSAPFEELDRLACTEPALAVPDQRATRPSPVVAVAAPPAADSGPDLRVLALGQSKVYRDERLLSTADWTYAKPREMLFFLLSHPPRTKEQIGVMLWPDASPNQLRAALHPALYHLRRTLGDRRRVVTRQDSYSFNRDIPYYFDVDEFESLVTQARRYAEKAPNQAIADLKAAVALYQGDFLADMTVTSEWALIRREELRQTFLEALLLLGRLLLEAQRYTEAADIYRRAIAQDSYLEVAHRELMRCYQLQGEISRALKHYQGLVEYLRTEMASVPAPETTALFQRLAAQVAYTSSGK